jgi:hypothetical protein
MRGESQLLRRPHQDPEFGMTWMISTRDPQNPTQSASEDRESSTWTWSSPDALNGKDPSPAMDVYPFAVIAYELATGRPRSIRKCPPLLLPNSREGSAGAELGRARAEAGDRARVGA